MSYDYAANILRLRKLAEDTATANYASQEVPLGRRDDINTVFKLQRENIVPSSLYVTDQKAGTYRTQAGFTVDTAVGAVTFTTPPPSTEDPDLILYTDYNWYWFLDADHTEFLDQGSEILGINKGSDIPEGLLPAQMQFALYYYYMRRSTRFANRYASSGGIAGQSVDVVTKNFKVLADAAWDAGIALRDAYYTRQGQRQAPASAAFNYNMDPFTPKR